MSTHLVHYAIAKRNAAVITEEWNADRTRGRSHRTARARRPRITPLAGVGQVWDAARRSFEHLAIVPVPVAAR